MPRNYTPKLNPDGVSVKGCSIIYAPRGQALEYAPLSTNPYRGCGHKCAYCYVPRAIKIDRGEFNQGAVVRPGYLDKLRREARKYQQLGVREQVMLSFSTDPYPPQHHIETRTTLQILQKHGLAVCTLTKGGRRAVRDLDLFRPERDAFASTLTSLDPDFSRKWEPDAALPDERLETLRRFHDAGIFTWASLEPTLDIDASLEIVQETHGFVDHYKIGRVNYIGMTKTTDWEDYTLRMIELVQELGVSHYFKKDLQKYLPDGYHNPMRVEQHHGPAGINDTTTKPEQIGLEVRA